MRIIEKDKIREIVDKARERASREDVAGLLTLCASCTDHTIMDEYYAASTIKAVADTIAETGIPEVASVCVFPSVVENAGLELGESPIAITALCGAFPHGQSYIEVKMLECAMAIENGADEIEIVIDISAMLSGEYERAAGEIATISEEIADDALLRVTLETGTLAEPELIYRASRIAMDSGADFIKTSTGKTSVSATETAAAIMCIAIGDHFRQTGCRVGFIAAGGIDDARSAMVYVDIAQQILGSDWLTPQLLRISGEELLPSIVKHYKELR